MKVSGFSDPILYYKLDPGEMGIASPSTAMLSVSHVAGHETGNMGRAYAEAAANGGFVVYSAITLDMRKRGLFLAAVAGKTTVEIYYPHGKRNRTNNYLFKQIEDRLRDALNVLENSLKNENDPERRMKIEKRIARIENMLASLRMGRIPLQNVESLVNAYA